MYFAVKCLTGRTFGADEVFVLYNVVCFIFGKCTENIFTMVFDKKGQHAAESQIHPITEKVVNLSIWIDPVAQKPADSSQLHKCR